MNSQKLKEVNEKADLIKFIVFSKGMMYFGDCFGGCPIYAGPDTDKSKVQNVGHRELDIQIIILPRKELKIL